MTEATETSPIDQIRNLSRDLHRIDFHIGCERLRLAECRRLLSRAETSNNQVVKTAALRAKIAESTRILEALRYERKPIAFLRYDAVKAAYLESAQREEIRSLRLDRILAESAEHEASAPGFDR